MTGQLAWTALALLAVLGGALSCGEDEAQSTTGGAGDAAAEPETSDVASVDARDSGADVSDGTGCADKPGVSEGGPASLAAILPTARYVSVGKLVAPVFAACLDTSGLSAHSALDGFAPHAAHVSKGRALAFAQR